MVLVRENRQEAINRILRPNKTRFGTAKTRDPFGVMEHAGRTKLRFYRPQKVLKYEEYFDFKTNTVKINYDVPTCGKTVRITDMEGNVRRDGRRSTRHGRYRVKYIKETFIQQKLHAYKLLDECFVLLAKHKAKAEGKWTGPIPTPGMKIHCRYREDFQAGNFTRFSDIWMILISESNPLFKNIRHEFDPLDAIQTEEAVNHLPADLIFEEDAGPNTNENIPPRLAKYKERIYGIIHGGYNLYMDSKVNTVGTDIDGVRVRSKVVFDEK